MINYKEYDIIVKELKVLSMSKNREYGDNSLILFGKQGLYIRFFDKSERLKNILYNKNKDFIINNESEEDNIKDMINYLIYILLYNKKKLIKNGQS